MYAFVSVISYGQSPYNEPILLAASATECLKQKIFVVTELRSKWEKTKGPNA
jgi:hypothetical protein